MNETNPLLNLTTAAVPASDARVHAPAIQRSAFRRQSAHGAYRIGFSSGGNRWVVLPAVPADRAADAAAVGP
jgi:hypothetical protein